MEVNTMRPTKNNTNTWIECTNKWNELEDSSKSNILDKLNELNWSKQLNKQDRRLARGIEMLGEGCMPT